MGRKKQKDEAKNEKPIFGSGADVEQLLKGDGFVKCVCTVACAWQGYHDEGDKVFIKRELLEGDPFFKGHFKPIEPLPEVQRRWDGEGEGEVQGEGEDETAAGEGETAADGNETAADGNGQGEHGLK